MDTLDPLSPQRRPSIKRPLLGMTILVVEDSRFASEALRLMCLRSGARIRRADCLKSARRHLQVYRPSAVIIDIGLPDGLGVELIEELSRATPRVGVLLAISGDDSAEKAAMDAGADGFLSKPIDCLGTFQHAILSSLPPDRQPRSPCPVSTEVIEPDQVAFQDDMAHMADLLDDHQDGPVLDYVAQFLQGVAKAAEDGQLQAAARDLARARTKGDAPKARVKRLIGLVQERLNHQIAI